MPRSRWSVLFTVLVALILALPASAARNADNALPASNIEKLYLVLLNRPANPPSKTPAELKLLRQQHLGYLGKLYLQGKLLVSGPVAEEKNLRLRGTCLYRVGTAEEARELAAADPLVKSGRLEVQVFAWSIEQGHLGFKPPPGTRASPEVK